jgi:hypothetical protein
MPPPSLEKKTMKAGRTSETPVNIYQTIRRYTSDANYLRILKGEDWVMWTEFIFPGMGTSSRLL